MANTMMVMILATRTFGALVRQEREDRDLSQREVGAWFGLSDAAVNKWEADRSVPAPAIVFELEQRFDLPPGYLSRTLGYLPVEPAPPAPDVLSAIDADPTLQDHEKSIMRAVYREARKRPRPI